MPGLPREDSERAGLPVVPAASPSSASAQAGHSILLGPYGLRAGWSLLLFFLAYALLSASLTFTFGRATNHARGSRDDNRAALSSRSKHSPTVAESKLVHVDTALSREVGQAAAVLLAAFGMARLERRRFAVYGLPRPRWGHLLGGTITGLAALSLLAGTLHALHLLVFDGRLLSASAALRFGTEWLVVFAAVGLFEEFLFRGYIQYTLARGLLGAAQRLSPTRAKQTAFWLAAVCWSLLFLLFHLGNRGETAVGVCAAFVAGLLFSYALWRTGSLWWALGFHMTWDWSESFLYGVPDSGLLSAGRLFSTHAAGNPLLSGGSAGPEGSLLVIPVLLLVVVVLQVWPQTPPPLALADDYAFSKREGMSPGTLPGERIA